MIWGKKATISSSILYVTNHLTANHLIYNQVTQTDPNFPTKVVFIKDQADQQVIRSALNAKDCSEVGWTALDFGFTLRQIQTRQFNCFLPKALHHQNRSSIPHHQRHQGKNPMTNINERRSKESQTRMINRRTERN
jgi:hypothetical protein